MTPEKWNDPNDRILGLRRACRCPGDATDITFLVLNPGLQEAICTLPEPEGDWLLLLDSADPFGPGMGMAVSRTFRVAASSVQFMSFTPRSVAKERLS